MSAVLASYVKMSTLVDGTMRVVLDIEPSAAADAFRLLGSPGTPIALARLTNEAAQSASVSPRQPERKPLTVASKAALVCGEPTFYDFLVSNASGLRELVRTSKAYLQANRPENSDFGDDDTCAEVLRRYCGITSRSDLNTNERAADKWRSLEASYHDWQRRAA